MHHLGRACLCCVLISHLFVVSIFRLFSPEQERRRREEGKKEKEEGERKGGRKKEKKKKKKKEEEEEGGEGRSDVRPRHRSRSPPEKKVKP